MSDSNDLPEPGEWIDFNEQKPPIYQSVLFSHHWYGVFIGRWTGDRWSSWPPNTAAGVLDDPEHWTTIPSGRPLPYEKE